MNKRGLVVGGAGFIGSHLVDRLVADGWDVDVVDDLSSGDKKNVNKDAVFFKRDFASDFVLEAVYNNRYDTVFHLAARPRVSYSIEHPSETNETNVQKTVELLESCRGRVGRFVFSSSSSVYGGADVLPTPNTYPKDPKSPYALQKSNCEDYCRMFSDLYGLDTVCLRYFNVFGPRAKGDGPYATAVSAWLSAIKSGRPLRSDGDGSQSRDMCYVDNVVSANVLAANATQKFNGQCYNVACGDRTTNREVLDFLKKKFPQVAIINAPWRAGDVMHTQADISRTVSELGFVPTVRFWEGLEITMKAEGLI